jgi:hypothetical protein
MGLTSDEKRALKRCGGAPDLGELPVRVPRDAAAKLVSQYFFQVSPRSMERWPMRWRRLNGRSHCETSELFAIAGAMLAAAPPVMGGKRTAGKQ